jgi:hypothetical protein
MSKTDSLVSLLHRRTWVTWVGFWVVEAWVVMVRPWLLFQAHWPAFPKALSIPCLQIEFSSISY